MNCVKCGVSATCTDGSGQWWCKGDFPYTRKIEHEPLSCNMHGSDASCKAAEEEAGKKLTHCYDEGCSDCFGD